MTGRLCERRRNGAGCSKGAGGGPAEAVELVDGLWYCRSHAPAAKAVASKRRDRGLGICSVTHCSRPAAVAGGKRSEHLAGERAAGASVVLVEEGSGRGEHPYAPKATEVYLVVFPELGLLKIGKATPWTVRSRVRDAGDKVRVRLADGEAAVTIMSPHVAWAIPLFSGTSTLWAVSERVEHAAAGRLAHNTGATSVDHSEGKEWLRHSATDGIDWPAEFLRAVRETLAFLDHSETDAGDPRKLS